MNWNSYYAERRRISNRRKRASNARRRRHAHTLIKKGAVRVA